MKYINRADKYYSQYAIADWKRKISRADIYHNKWLESQMEYIPSNHSGLYSERIIDISEAPYLENRELEEKLVTLRFDYSAEIDGRILGYRELLSESDGKDEQDDIRKALLDEAFMLIDNGLSDLIKARNSKAAESGYENFWIMKNFRQADVIGDLLSRLDKLLQTSFVGAGNWNIGETGKILLKEAVIFFCGLLYSRCDIPRLELRIRKGRKCRNGPAGLYPLAYRPGKGHLFGIELPFVTGEVLEPAKLGVLFHELTHLFHFASVDDRGGYLFPSQLAQNDLIYESEALAFQNIFLSAWNKTGWIPNWNGLKDLVYVAETERQIYEIEDIDRNKFKALIFRRIDEHYPSGLFKGTPLGPSHILRDNYACKYWIYSAAQLHSFARTREILKEPDIIAPPDFWSEGNSFSYRLKLAELLNPDAVQIGNESSFSISSSFVKKDGMELFEEMKRAGLGPLLK